MDLLHALVAAEGKREGVTLVSRVPLLARQLPVGLVERGEECIAFNRFVQLRQMHDPREWQRGGVENGAADDQRGARYLADKFQRVLEGSRHFNTVDRTGR